MKPARKNPWKSSRETNIFLKVATKSLRLQVYEYTSVPKVFSWKFAAGMDQMLFLLLFDHVRAEILRELINFPEMCMNSMTNKIMSNK